MFRYQPGLHVNNKVQTMANGDNIINHTQIIKKLQTSPSVNIQK